MVKLTPKAIEVIVGVIDEDPTIGDYYVRVAIRGGGCSGYTYALDFDGPDEDDLVLSMGPQLDVVIDPHSAQLLAGTTIDYQDQVWEKGFVFINPNARTTCGCGQSWSR